MIILSNEDVEQLLTHEDCMESLEVAYKELFLGLGANRPRTHTYFPLQNSVSGQKLHYRFKSQEGGNLSNHIWALRISSELMGEQTLPNGVINKKLIPAASGNKYCGLIYLYSTENIEPIAIIQDSYIQRMRCSATSALGIKYLANPNIEVAGLFGCGWQAASHLEFLIKLRPNVKEIRVFSPLTHECVDFVEKYKKILNKNILVAKCPNEVVFDSDLIICATNSSIPCFDGRLVKKGTHISTITHPDGVIYKREIDDETYDKANKIVVLSKDQLSLDKQIDILGVVKRGLKKDDDIIELGALISGKNSGRESSEDITIFANNTGMGIQFAAVGSAVLKLAKKKGVGREVPTDWFLESTPS